MIPKQKRTRLGIFPDDWDAKVLSKTGNEVIDGDRGKEYPKANEFSNSGHCLFLSAKNVTKSGFSFDKCQFISKNRDSRLRKGKLERDDIVITTRGTVGNIALYSSTIPYEHIRINSGMAIIRSRTSSLYKDFLYALLQSHVVGEQIKRLSFGSAQPQLTIALINDFLVPIPSLPEQKKIALILGKWDALIIALKKHVKAKQKYKKGLMQQLLTGKRQFSEFAGQVWSDYHLGDLFVERKESDRADLPLLAITSDRGVIPREQINRKDSSSEDKSNYKRIAPGDIGYNTMRMWQGVSALSELEGIVSPAYTICTPKKLIDAQFAAYFFKYPPVVNLFYRYSQGLVSDTLGLKFPNFSKIKVTIPQPDEQKRIASVLATCDRELTLLKAQAEALKKQKKGLMQKLLTGQIRVKGD